MPGHNPPTSTRCGKGFKKAETTTLLKAIERVLPLDAEGWNEVHDIFNSKHSLIQFPPKMDENWLRNELLN